MAGKILELEHQDGGEWVPRFHVPKGGLPLPSDTKDHVLKAKKEVLLALRGLVDLAIEKAEKEEQKQSKKSTKIPVQ